MTLLSKSSLPQPLQSTALKVITVPSSEITLANCLTGVQLSAQVRKYGHKVHEQLVDEVNLCAVGLGVALTADQLMLLVNDMVEVYKFETMEDLMLVLKQGRQGFYGTTYSKFSMIVFVEWFNQHQEKKADARDIEHQKSKNWGREPMSIKEVEIHYEDYKEKMKDEKPMSQAEFLIEKERQIQEMRAKYFNK